MSQPSVVSISLGRLLPHLPILIPLVFSAVMAAAFGQPLFLLFGVMGPVMAISQRFITRQRDRDAQAARERVDDAAQRQASEQSARAVEAWRDKVLSDYPSVDQWLHNPLWRAAEISDETQIRVGLGEADPPRDIPSASRVPGVPITIGLCQTVALVGHGPDALARWRAIFCQVVAVVVASDRNSGDFLHAVWPTDTEPPSSVTVPGPRGEPVGYWCFVQSIEDLPRDVSWVITSGEGGSSLLYYRGVVKEKVHTPDRLGFARSRWVRSRLLSQLPDRPLQDGDPVDFGDRRHLYATLDADSTPVDLVDNGPHALVWGKTGSGKSVLLQRLIISLATSYPPELFGFVGIDFKGGATLGPLAALPHCQGVLTDLAAGSWARVATSLRAEVTAREEHCAVVGVPGWAELPPEASRPRTLIVVDEAGTVATEAPALMGVLTDIAQRGRSLGLHLVFSTQRPHQLPREVVANCALRWCLGVTDADEVSHYLPETPKNLLIALTRAVPGTVLTWSESAGRLIRPSTVGSQEVEAIATAGGHRQKPLWCQPLPLSVSAPEGFPGPIGGGYLLGVADIPQRQRHESVVWEPGADGPLIIAGESQSGHTSCTAVLATQARASSLRVVTAPHRPDGLCDVLQEVCSDVGGHPALLIVDRLDRILAGVSPQAEAWIYDRLTEAATSLFQRLAGSGLVVTVGPGSPCVSALSRWSATWCLMRHRDPEQWSGLGGDRTLFDRELPPGRAFFRGQLIQWIQPRTPSPVAAPDAPVRPAPEGTVVVLGRSAEPQPATAMTVAEAETAHRQLSQSLAGGGVIFAGVNPHHMRQLIGPGYDYPPVASHDPYGWWVTTEGFRLVDLSDYN